MFKKLISNLPFNPSLLGTVSFYAKRLKAEESIRRLGFAFMALALFIQMFAVIAPPQKSLAYSSADDYIEANGFASKQAVLAAWDNPNKDIKAIYSHFGITRDMIVNLSPIVHINSGADNLWTTGRTSVSQRPDAASIKQIYKDTERPITIGGETIYYRNLKSFDIKNPTNNYDAYEGIKADGSKFWILKTCGNYTDIYTPPAPVPTPTPTPTPAPRPPATPIPTPAQPALEFRKTIDGGNVARRPGDLFSYRFEYRNTVPNSTNATNVSITDTFDLDHFDIVSSSKPLSFSGHVGTIAIGTLEYTPEFKPAVIVTVKLKANLNNGQSICNAATLSASNASSVTSGGSGLCFGVLNPCPYNPNVPSASDAACLPVVICSLTQTAFNRTTKEMTFTTTVTSSAPTLTPISSYVYSFGDNSSKNNNSTGLTDTVKHVYKDGNFHATVTVYYSINGKAGSATSAACASDVESKPDQPLSPSKLAQNISQKLSTGDTLKTKANAGDVIEYSLIVHNSYDYDRASYTISDSIADVLDYTDIDLTFIQSQGGTFDSATKSVVWANQVVKANSDLIKKFRVTVKNPVPSTNQPSNLTTSYDCHIANTYGTSTTSIPINCPPAKTAEYLATTLPNTGPGTSAMVGGLLMIVVAYFFYRSRLLGKELELVRAEYATGGGF